MPDKHSRILIVDDDPEWLAVIRELLEEEGYTVASAKDGQKAAALAPWFHPSVVVTDLQMPKMDGRELLANLSAQDPDIPVIVVTADRAQAHGPGLEAAFLVMDKPPSIDKFLAALADASSKAPN